jgi:hypothetical protein
LHRGAECDYHGHRTRREQQSVFHRLAPFFTGGAFDPNAICGTAEAKGIKNAVEGGVKANIESGGFA